jgi:hypothetical protein
MRGKKMCNIFYGWGHTERKNRHLACSEIGEGESGKTYTYLLTEGEGGNTAIYLSIYQSTLLRATSIVPHNCAVPLPAPSLPATIWPDEAHLLSI